MILQWWHASSQQRLGSDSIIILSDVSIDILVRKKCNLLTWLLIFQLLNVAMQQFELIRLSAKPANETSLLNMAWLYASRDLTHHSCSWSRRKMFGYSSSLSDQHTADKWIGSTRLISKPKCQAPCQASHLILGLITQISLIIVTKLRQFPSAGMR